jgi:hypothetical protein
MPTIDGIPSKMMRRKPVAWFPQYDETDGVIFWSSSRINFRCSQGKCRTTTPLRTGCGDISRYLEILSCVKGKIIIDPKE